MATKRSSHDPVSRPPSSRRRVMDEDEVAIEDLQQELEREAQLLAGGVMKGMELKRHQRLQLRVADNFVSLAKAIEAPLRTDKPVKVTFEGEGGKLMTESFDLLVLAANPEELGQSGVLNLTAQEKEVYSQFKYATFQTTLLKVEPAPPKTNSVRFNPGTLSAQAGSIYGYRSETRKTFQKLPLNAKYELVTVYQLLNNKDEGNLTSEEFFTILEEELKTQESLPEEEAWFPYKYSTAQVIGEPFNTRYFNRFDLEGLQDRQLPWKLIDLQGKNNTINMHASCCFESVLHIYQYMDLLAKERPDIFPSDRRRTRIGIIGAGPSGLLAARKLGEMGYSESNMVMFEKANNVVNPQGNMLAGKTQTRTQIQLGKLIPAELGTCYLSPAYNDMMRDISDITVDNERIAFDQTAFPFRAIVSEGMFAPNGPVMTLWNSENKQLREDIIGEGLHGEFPATIDYDIYTKVKAFEETATVKGNDPIPRLEKQYSEIDFVMGLQVIGYCFYHFKTFGLERPIPFECPDELKDKNDLGGLTIGEFLEKNGFKALIGTLQYAYSVQGYGALESDMPAWYLLIWITPQTLIPAIMNQLKGFLALCKSCLIFKIFGVLKPEAIVTALSRGWGDVWLQQKNQLDDDGVTVYYNTNITSITRDT